MAPEFSRVRLLTGTLSITRRMTHEDPDFLVTVNDCGFVYRDGGG